MHHIADGGNIETHYLTYSAAARYPLRNELDDRPKGQFEHCAAQFIFDLILRTISFAPAFRKDASNAARRETESALRIASADC